MDWYCFSCNSWYCGNCSRWIKDCKSKFRKRTSQRNSKPKQRNLRFN
uniref:RING/Ubox like zinc-binding domain protein n=1 Tax=Siphoviridae sp. ctkzC12 TaxID=2826446 RepID=A0A8S5LVG6_9CAUD|nr:MAG TPA: RING/Ubox like zinc-binding domain protein [Siphoviridae sp. ctkzC12]